MKEVLTKALTHREFLKMCGLAIVGTGAGQLVVPPKPVEAYTYNEDLTVNGNVYVTGNIGIGTSSPSHKFQVSGGNIMIDRNYVIGLRQDVSSTGHGGFWFAQPSSSNHLWINVSNDPTTRRKVLFGTSSDDTTAGMLASTVSIEPLTGAIVTLATGNAITLGGGGASIAFAGGGLGQITTALGYDLAIMPGRNLGIGTTTPDARLHLDNAGTIKIGTQKIADSGGCYYA